MPIVKTEGDIKKRIHEVEQRLEQIHNAAAKELERPFFERKSHVFQFLDVEKRTYRAVLQELRWIIKDPS